MASIRSLRIAVLGGDLREVELINSLVEHGAFVSYYGCPDSPDLLKTARLAASPLDAVQGAKVMISPITGTDVSGNLRTAQKPIKIDRDLLGALAPLSMLLIGSANEFVRSLCSELGINIVETANDDELAILNSIPSAEGAIQIAMQETPFTIHSSNILILGFGRTGQTLARMCSALGANVSVAARKPRDLARIFESKYRPVAFTTFSDGLGSYNIIFNTVPQLVLPKELLLLTRQGCVIIDLASSPGGVDFEAAKALGIKAILAPGLPGKVAPKTAGQILAQVIPRLIVENIPK